MNKNIRVLIVEDSESDALLAVRQLQTGGYRPIYRIVDTAGEMVLALQGESWDVVLADHSLPRFDSFSALHLLRENHLDIPFIVVSGEIGEDAAIGAMKAGAHDYIMKGSMKRLCAAVERELHEAVERRKRREAEGALRSAAQHWRQTFDSMKDGVAVLSTSHHILRANEALARLVGEDIKDIVGRFCFEVFHSAESPLEGCPLLACITSRKPGEWEFQEPKLGNKIIHTSASPMVDADGRLVSAVYVVRDISVEKKRQRSLERLYGLSRGVGRTLDLSDVARHAARHVAEAFGDRSTVAVYLAGEDGLGTILSFSGLQADRLKGKKLLKSDLPRKMAARVLEQRQQWVTNDCADMPSIFASNVEPGASCSFAAVPLLSGSQFFGILMAFGHTPFDDEDSSFLGAAGQILSLAVQNCRLYERTDAALSVRVNELQALARMLESIMESMGEGLVVMDACGKVIYFNGMAQELLSLPARDIVGQPKNLYYEMLASRIREPQDWRIAVAKAFKTAVANGHVCVVVENPMGQKRNIQATLFKVRSEASIIGTGAIFRDVTIEMEVDRMKSEFISIASHEMRTPMTSIYGFSEFLLTKSEQLPVGMVSWVQTIYEESRRLTKIIEDTLSVSRIESGRLSLKLESVALRPLVEALGKRFRVGNDSHTIIEEVNGGPVALADRAKLEQVVANLVENAIKYSPRGGEVRITVKESPGRVVVDVSDQGMGIPSSEVPKLFTKFHRVSRIESAGVRGTGLGLYIVKSIAEQMKGRVWVDTEVDKGSTFHVELPAGQKTFPGQAAP